MRGLTRREARTATRSNEGVRQASNGPASKLASSDSQSRMDFVRMGGRFLAMASTGTTRGIEIDG
jgi:hypothetical protein